MTDSLRPIAAATELRRRISATDSDIPVIATNPFNVDARKKIGDEFVLCTGFGVDASGWPVLTGCQRGLSQEEGGSPQRAWPGGTPVLEVPWTTTEVVTEYPVATEAMVGRNFVWDPGTGTTYRYHVVRIEGTPVIIWDDEPPAAATAMAFLWATQITGLTGVRGVALDASGNIYTEGSTHNKKFSAALSELFSTSGPAGRAHVASDGTSVFTTGGTFSDLVYKKVAATWVSGSPATFGSTGTGDGQFSGDGPIGICFDGTNVWVVDTGNNRVQKFTASSGAYVSQFAIPAGSTGITLGPTSTHLYVLNAGAGTIQKRLKSDHSLVSTFTLGTGTADGQISTTTEGIAVDSTGRIWVSDTGNHRIQVFDSAGAFLAKIGEFGSGNQQFKSPKQIAAAADDAIWIADSGNNRLVTVQEAVTGLGGTTELLVFAMESVEGAATDTEWANQPAAETEMFGAVVGFRSRTYRDLGNATQVRLTAAIGGVDGHTTAILYTKYSTDGGTNWNDLVTGKADQVSIFGASALHVGSWVNIVEGAKDDVLLQVFGSGGNGVVDPKIFRVTLEIRRLAGERGPAGPPGEPGASGSGTGDVIGPASSVASELALFDGTTGKLIKRATGTGIVKTTAGVYSANASLNQSETHGSPDTDVGPTSLHHTIGAGANQAAAGNHAHTPDAGVYDAGTLVIAAGSVTLPTIPANIAAIRLIVDTEAAAATDDLTTVVPTGTVADGTILVIGSANNARDVTTKHGASTNLLYQANGDFLLGAVGEKITYVRGQGQWIEVSRSNFTGIFQAAGTAGDVSGPAASIDGEGVLFNGTTGKLIKRSALTGILKATAGVHAAAVAGTDYLAPAAIGTTVQAFDQDLSDLAGLARARGDLITGGASAWVRQAKGTALQHLRMNAAATDIEWSDDDEVYARFRLGADGANIGPAIANFFGANSAFSTVAGDIYEFEAFCVFTKNTAGTVVFTLTNSVNYTAASIATPLATLATANAARVGAVTAAATPASASLTTGAMYGFVVRGLLEINTAGNVRLNITSSAGTVSPQRTSFYRVRRIGSGNIGSFTA